MYACMYVVVVLCLDEFLASFSSSVGLSRRNGMAYPMVVSRLS